MTPGLLKANPLMWSHYAAAHQGICLEFTPRLESYFANAQPMTYTSSFPILDLHRIVVDSQFRDTAPWMLMKSEDWSYEDEYRVLDFTCGPGAKTFPAECLSGIYLGCRADQDKVDLVRSWVDEFHPTIPLYYARKAPGEFKLTFERLV